MSLDSQTLDELIAEYLRAADSGTPPDRDDFLRRHDEHRTGLESFFADYDAMQAATGGAATDDEDASRYVVLGEIARGGMGAVLRAIDTRFRRPVALKVIRDDRATERLLRRFDLESDVTGRLQHPGIPPVHDRGRLPDGRRYLAMKLIEGRTLQDLLDARSSPADRLSHFLGVFEQICGTLAYAHAEGVVHRDLKPLNVMVGAFGEVQVMDWGMARDLGRTPPPEDVRSNDGGDTSLPDTPIDYREQETYVPVSGSDTAETVDAPSSWEEPPDERLTRAGEMMGTPGYMPPEQARGDETRMDRRSDVFGLGGILCTILTGEPPYRKVDDVPVLARAQVADLADARDRLETCGADDEVIALAMACLAEDHALRPADAGEVWRTIADHLEAVQQRLERERIERAEAEARAEADRRRRRLATLLALVVVLASLSVAWAATWYFRDRANRDAEARTRSRIVESGVRLALDDAEAELDKLEASLADPKEYRALANDPAEWEARIATAHAHVERAAATQRTGESAGDAERLAAVRSRVERAGFDRIAAMEFDMIRFSSITVLAGREGPNDAIDPTHLSRRMRTHLARLSLDVDADDIAARVKRSPIRHAIVDGLDFWALAPDRDGLRERLLAVTQEIDSDEFRDRLRDPATWDDPDAIQGLVADQQVVHQPPGALQVLTILSIRAGGDPRPMLHAAITLNTRDFALHYTLAVCTRDVEEGIGAFRAALAVRPDAAVAYTNLGRLLVMDGRVDAAIFSFERALELQGHDPAAHNNLGYTLLGLGRYAAAESHLLEALRQRPTYAFAHNNLGLVYERTDRLELAAESFREAIRHSKGYRNAEENLARVLARIAEP